MRGRRGVCGLVVLWQQTNLKRRRGRGGGDGATAAAAAAAVPASLHLLSELSETVISLGVVFFVLGNRGCILVLVGVY